MKFAFKTLAVLALLAAAFVLYCNVRIQSYAAPRIYDDVRDVPHRHAALLLGTSPNVRGGLQNMYFVYRIEACAELYKGSYNTTTFHTSRSRPVNSGNHFEQSRFARPV